MEWTPVASAAIAAIGYAPEDRVLRVRFCSGGAYAYFDVAPDLHAAFLAAESKGRFFHARVDGRYRFSRLDRP